MTVGSPRCKGAAYGGEQRCRRRALWQSDFCWQHDEEYEPVPKVVGFSVSGEWLVETARRIYWYERREAAAYEILGTLRADERGITFEEMKEILNGDATLAGDSRTGIEIVGEADWPFKNELTELAKERAREEARLEAEKAKPPIPDFSFDDDSIITLDPVPSEPSMYAEAIARPLGDHVAEAIGGFLDAFAEGALHAALRPLLRLYVASVRRQRIAARIAPFGGLAPHEIEEAAAEDEKRRGLHERVLNELGYTHVAADRFEDINETKEGRKLDEAISALLNVCVPPLASPFG